VRDFHAAEDELAPGDQLMNVIADAYVNHARRIRFIGARKKTFPEVLATDKTQVKNKNAATVARRVENLAAFYEHQFRRSRALPYSSACFKFLECVQNRLGIGEWLAK
jgi:hypothetical protein